MSMHKQDESIELALDSTSEFTCEVCLLELTDNAVNTPCHTDKLCKDCWKQYVLTAAQEMSYRAGAHLKCPVCENRTIDPEFVMASLDRDSSDILGEKFLDVYLRQSKDVQRCPLSRCKFAYLPESCSIFKQSELQCPMCFTSLSRGFSLSLTPIITFIYITFMTNNCPKCEIPIDRVSGCYHMTCSCGHEFCWYCLKNYHNVRESQYRQHNQKDCLFLFLTKVLILLLVTFSMMLVVSGSDTYSWALQKIWTGLVLLMRALVTDGAIVAQGIVLNRMNTYYRPFKRMLLTFLLADVFIGLGLWYFGELAYTLLIMGVSVAVALGCLGIGLMVEFSVGTWFNYIQ